MGLTNNQKRLLKEVGTDSMSERDWEKKPAKTRQVFIRDGLIRNDYFSGYRLTEEGLEIYHKLKNGAVNNRIAFKIAMRESDIKENARFYDPRQRWEGTLVKRKYHQTTLWMMLFDNGEIEELTNSDLRRIKKI